MATKAKRGRPPGGEYADKSTVINFRIRPDTKRLLQDAAHTSGRTLSQEAEHQLRRALIEMEAGPTYAFLQTIGQAIDKLVNFKDPKANWLHDPYLYRQARGAITAALDLFQPANSPPDVATEQLDLGGTHQGRMATMDLVRKIQLADSSTPLAKQTSEQRLLVSRKVDLGALADRPQVYGRTAEQARQEHEIGSEFGPLMRKAERDPDQMTNKDWRQLRRLAEALADLRSQEASK